MNFKDHIELRNNLHQESLRAFRYNMEWLSDYLSSMSKWRIKVLLKNKVRCRRKSQSISCSVKISDERPSGDFDIGADELQSGLNEYSQFCDTSKPDKMDYKHGSKEDAYSTKTPKSFSINVSNGVSPSSDLNNNKTEKNELVLSDEKATNGTASSVCNGVDDEYGSNYAFKSDKNHGKDHENMQTYRILACSNETKSNDKRHNTNYNTFGYTLWDYLPLIALLNGCTGIFILFRLSSLMYRYSILSCTISHLVTFMLIGIPMSQLEFAIRKRGRRCGLLEGIRSLNPKFVGLTILSLITTIFIFLYSFHIIGTLSIVIYNIPKTNWRVTLGDAYICNKINQSLEIKGDLLDSYNENTVYTDVYNFYSLCSYSPMCNVVSPFYQNITKVELNYGDNRHTNLDEISINDEYFTSVFTSFIESVSLFENDLNNTAYSQKPIWCVPSSSKKLRNLLIVEQSNYKDMLYFSLDSSTKNPEKVVNTNIFPIKNPINKLNKNIVAKIVGISVSFVFVLLSINGGGKFFRVISFLSLLSLITLLLSATIQTVANEVQLNIFVSMLVTQDGVEHLLSPSIWYSSINNTLLFFGISFFISMFPLSNLNKRLKDSYDYECQDEFINYCNSDINSCDSSENSRSNTNSDEYNGINYYSLRSSIKSASFFLLYIVLSSMVVIVANSALISLSESPNTHLLFPFNTKIYNSTRKQFNSPTYDSSYFDMVGYSKISEVRVDTKNKKPAYLKLLLETGLHVENKMFNKHLRTLNSEYNNKNEINFLKNQLILWYKMNLYRIKSRSLILGEYMIIYLIITAIEVSNRIPRGVIIFFIVLIFSYAISSACISACIITNHVSVIFNEWVYPLYLRRNNNSRKGTVYKNKQNFHSRCLSVGNTRDAGYTRNNNKSGSFRKRLLKLCQYVNTQVANYFGIYSDNKIKRRMETITLTAQMVVLFILIVLVFLINIASLFIVRLPVDKEDLDSEKMRDTLRSNNISFLNPSNGDELSRIYNNEIYVLKNNILFGSLFDIRIISSAVNLMLSITAGIEIFMLTWHTNKDVPTRIIGFRSLNIHYIGQILSIVPLSIGFLLGTKIAFGLCLFASVLVFVSSFFASRYCAKQKFAYNDQLVVKRQKYSPTWWLCISNIDILRRKFNSKELIDAGLLSYYSDEYTINNESSFSTSNSNSNSKYCEDLRKNENINIIKNISNFNLYCSVRSHQPQFVELWIILAKYFSTILIKSTIPLTIVNIISLLLRKSDCLEGLFSGCLNRKDYLSGTNGAYIIDYTENYSIFQPLQLFIIILFSLSGIVFFVLITNYICKKEKVLNNNENIKNGSYYTVNPISDPLEVNIDNILNDVYESLNVPIFMELYSDSKVNKLGKMPQKLIINLASIERVIE
ncbi:hypothetical protein FG386_002697 [Cryptosporidium ryanae]|uniref:uncharacterized protein n=1 Tax=Cryptosporidium ryanae TaxID=515981 RepID=UPI00351A7D40|nr:hypothetical protein FG386_002697 [Cryptosporidium ryanae]